MAAEADRVVVELIAKNDQFDANVRQSSAAYQRGMKDIETAGMGAEKAHGRLTASVGNSRIAMLEFQHIARGTADQIAAGAPLTQVLAQHMGMLGQAVTLAGGSFGRVGAVLGGPWGLALTVAAAGVATLIMRHKEETDTVEAVLQKRMKMHEQTLLNKQADEAWAHTLDGLIEGLQKTNDELGKRLKLQPVVDEQSLQQANAQLLKLGQGLVAAEDDPNTAPARLAKLRQAFSEAVKEVHNLTLLLGREEGQAITDLGARADQWAARQQDIIDRLQGYHPELQAFGADINAAFALMKKAVTDAAGANVPFDDVTRQVDALNNKLAQSPGSVREYVAELKKLATQLEAAADAAKKLAKVDPVAQFKAGIIGAEGTGPNRMGSPAAGYGQFMPGTWLTYFNRAFPQYANMPREAKLDYRNDKAVATAVIDKATDDYVAVLQAAGQQITAAALYTMHMLSAGDPRGRVALRLLTAPDNQSARSIVGNAAVNQNGNIFTGTAAQARSAIAGRIGDSSGAVSSAAVSIANQQAAAEERLHDQVVKNLNTEQEISVTKESQSELSREITGQVMTLHDLLQSGILPSLKSWEKEYDTIIASQEELNRFGGQLIDDVLNPDNWTSWGDMGKRVLHELEVELITLAAINPLKNLLTGSTLPTLGGLFSKLGGLFGGGPKTLFPIVNGVDPLAVLPGPPAPHLAGGGSFSVGGAAGDVHALSVDGRTRAMVSGTETVAVIPSNARAASPSAAQIVQVILGVEASEYFDARVLRTAGPVIAQSSVAAANGGATIGRRNLGREAHHRLEG
jgi:hypothetical protein